MAISIDLSVACPRCNVGPGKPCVAGRDLKPRAAAHRGRRNLALGDVQASKIDSPQGGIRRGQRVSVEGVVYIIHSIKYLYIGNKLTLITDMEKEI
jgi:hypothetical protein